MKTYGHVKPKHAEVLGLRVERDVPITTLIPEKFLPPVVEAKDNSSITTTMTRAETSSKKLSNGSAVPGPEAYLSKKRELEVGNEVAYEAIKRRGVRGEVKVVQYRKFFEALEVVGGFWDCSRDDKSTVGEERMKVGKEDKVQLQAELQEYIRAQEKESAKMNVHREGDEGRSSDGSKNGDGKTAQQTNEPSQESSIDKIMEDVKHTVDKHTNNKHIDERQNDSTYINDKHVDDKHKGDSPTNDKHIEHSSTTTSTPHTYTGHRLGTGSQMPESYRLDLIRTFLDPLLYPFGLIAEPPRSQPRLQLQNLLIPVRHSSVIYRAPTDMMRARAGWMEGPVVGVHCRDQIACKDDEEDEIWARILMDLFQKGFLTEDKAEDEMMNMVRAREAWFESSVLEVHHRE